MILYLVRHGDAVSSNVDPDRPLSEEGRRDVERMARHLAGFGVKVSEMWHSKKARAVQTAEILSQSLGAEIEMMQGLSPNDSVEPWLYQLRRREEDLMIVGHLPFLPALAQALIGYRQTETPLSLPASGVLVLERGVKGDWSLKDKYWPGQL